ncbi:MAG: hypothetical protein ACRD4T_12380, partial [Candidatus Acidiferrales bacterium]
AKLLRSFDSARKQWFLSYVDTGVAHQWWEGRWESGQWRFYRSWVLNGRPVISRVTWSPGTDDSYQQMIERSSDNGSSWEQTARIVFGRKKQ